MNVEEMMEILGRYPKDLKVVLLVNTEEETGLYYDVNCSGLKTDNNAYVYVNCTDLDCDFEMLKNGEQL